MDISIVIVSWNVKDRLRENLESIFKSEGVVSFEVFVVDNNSSDGSAEMARQEYPRVKLVTNKENFGFAKANNQAIKQARGRYILLLNPDMRVFPDTLKGMVNWMDEHEKTGISGCRLVDEQGKTVFHVRRFPRFFDQLAIIIKLPHLIPGVLNRYLLKDFDYNNEAEVDLIRGSFFMIRKEVIDKIGGLDEHYFLWFEEVDYCRQVRQAGWKIIYTPAVKCVDYVGKSFKQLPRGQTQDFFRDSMLKYFKKWHPAWQYRLLKIAWIAGIMATFLGKKLGLKSRAKT